MSEKRDKLHVLVDSIPEWRVGEAYELIKQQFFPPAPTRRPGDPLPKIVGMFNSGDPDFSDNASEALYGREKSDALHARKQEDGGEGRE
ncbi:hypothetical protein GCM10009799_23330 [Nocardiopsis rhodophaea]|uniref:Uncharacterized protein n=1 Tax=Nocardiopsis rhodophaea TaxID=280238 RepID=A0ABN2T0P4_9ACTN